MTEDERIAVFAKVKYTNKVIIVSKEPNGYKISEYL